MLITSLPVSLYKQTAMLDDETADTFKVELISRVQLLETIQHSLLGIGVALFALCLISYCVVRRRDNIKV